MVFLKFFSEKVNFENRFVGPDLGPNCLLRLSADNTDRQKVKVQWVSGSYGP